MIVACQSRIRHARPRESVKLTLRSMQMPRFLTRAEMEQRSKALRRDKMLLLAVLEQKVQICRVVECEKVQAHGVASTYDVG